MKLAGKRLLPLVLVAAILALSALAVGVMDHLEQQHALRADFSFNSITTQSEQTRQVLRGLRHPVHAYAIATPGMEDQALLGLLNRMAAESALFTYSRENLIQNPMLVNLISSALGDDQVSADSLVLVCEATGRTRVLDAYSFLAQSFDQDAQAFRLTGLAYEKSIVEALLYVTLDKVPRVRILSGHGELGQNETAHMESFLTGHHFEVGRVNLLAGDELLPEDLLMILSPQKDLLQSELEQLRAFTRQGGNIIITSDYGDPDSLPHFDALYRLMGFERKSGIVIAEGADLSAYIDNPLFLTPYMNMTEPTAALIGGGQTRLRLPGARALSVVEGSRQALVDPLLTSGQAYLKPLARANETLSHEEGDEQGQFDLALLSDYAQPDGSRARAMIIGNSAILMDSWLHEVTYGAQFLLHMVNYLSPGEPIQLDIAPRALVRESLLIDQPALPVLVLILMPALVLGLAIPVLTRRARRQ
ncbi:MAG: hypothetical protein GXY84_07740 [Clostridiales bacterium]|nr:hypothetical protein [Clostridiales bacterium]